MIFRYNHFEQLPSCVIMNMANSIQINYDKTQKLSGVIGRQSISFFTKPGLANWNRITPSMVLLAEAIHPKWSDKILNIGCNHGALAAYLGKQVNENNLFVMDNDQIALNCTEQTLRENGIQKFTIPSEISFLPQATSSFALIALDIPKGRKINRRWLVESFNLLEPGGSLYLAGPNDLGIQSIIKDAQDLFGNAVIVNYKKGNRCALVRKEKFSTTLPIWAEEPGIALGTWISLDVKFRSTQFKIFSLPGIFSYDRLDEGTELLLDTIQFPHQSNILDVGCGYGIIGLYAAFSTNASKIDLVDSNRLAVAATSKNLWENQAQHVQVFSSDLLEHVQNKRYHQIVSNPPFHTGKEVNYAVTQSLLRQSYQALLPEGQLILVANRFIRYDYWMKEIFGNCKILTQTNRFHILSTTKRS